MLALTALAALFLVSTGTAVVRLGAGLRADHALRREVRARVTATAADLDRIAPPTGSRAEPAHARSRDPLKILASRVLLAREFYLPALRHPLGALRRGPGAGR